MEFREFEINNFLGIATSTRHPNKSECQECLNFDTRFIDGDLTLRPGFTSKYTAPASADHRSKLSNITYLNFANFIPEGTTTEVTVWVGRGTLAAETFTLSSAPSPIDIITIFTSHQFNGTSWVAKNWDGTTNGRYWLNHCVLTKITIGGVGSPNTWEITLDADQNTITSDGFNGWVIYNVTKDDIAQVIDSVLTVSSMRVDISKSDHNWAAEDTVILMRHFIPYTELRELSNATASEVVFHKVLNDLRIGFGGKANRIGLSIGYRKKAFNIGGVTWGTMDVEDLSTINNLTLDPYGVVAIPNAYLLRELSKTAGTTPEGNYFIIMTVLLDGFNEIQILRTNIILDTASDISLTPAIRVGAFNKRITHLRLYISSNDADATEAINPYFFMKEYDLSQTTYNGGAWYISNDGYLHLPVATSELMTTQNAIINSATDYNNVDNLTTNNPSIVTIAAVTTSPAPPAGFGTYCAKITNTDTATKECMVTYTKANLFDYNKTYVINFKIYHNAAGSSQIKVSIDGIVTTSQYPVVSGWRDISLIVKCFNPDGYDKLTIRMFLATTEYLALDALSIKERGSEDITLGVIESLTTEVTAKMGYVPTFDMVKSWDQAIVTQGRTFFVNPYIDKRYENKIFASHISGAGAYMYDVASAERYIDLENFDGNKLVGIEILPNLQFVAFKTNGSQRVDPNTGQTRGINFGDGCVARRSIVNFGDRIVWCGENDIYMTDGLNITSIADKTIREAYRALTTKANIIATREERDNSYRFFTGDVTNKTEYIFTKKGWIKRTTAASIYPTAYYLESSGQVNFLHNGIIYDDDDSLRDPSSSNIIGEWKSVDIDAELLGPEITQRDFFYITSMWLDYTRNIGSGDDPNMQMLLAMNGSTVYTHTFQTVPGRQKLFIDIPTEKYNGRRFNLTVKIVSDSNEVRAKHISIHSVGVMWKLVKAGHYN